MSGASPPRDRDDLPGEDLSTDDVDDLAPFTLDLERGDHGERLDKVLGRRLDAVSRSAIQRWMDAGRIRMDDRVADRKTKAIRGARVEVHPLPPVEYDAEPEDLPLTILHEDAHLLVIDKAAGMVVHPAPGHARGTLVNALLHHTRVEGGSAERPGIVHRLDKDTSGVMVVAKNALTHERLVRMFSAHDLERRYVAITCGVPPESVTYDTFHHRHPTDRKRFTSHVSYGRRAVTHVERLEVFRGASRVECRLETGRTHQIRVHLADAGFPLLGDATYGSMPTDPRLRDAARAVARQALHAAVLGFTHPIEGTALRFVTPPPADFESALAVLRA